MKNALRTPTEKDPFADRRRWTIEDCRKLEAIQLLEADIYELLEGEIVIRQGRTFAHSVSHKKVMLRLFEIFGTDTVLPICSLAVDTANYPEADILVTRRPAQEYGTIDNPTPADMRLIVEVSDLTLWRDRNTKMRIYGSAGVPEYWVLDVNGRRLFVYRQPTATGYADEKEYDEAAVVAPLAAPNNP